MTRSRYRFLPDDPTPYFITATTVNWLPLFSNPDIVQILLGSLRFLIENQRLRLYAFVIMENHLHLVASSDDLGKEIANFKSYTARESIDFYSERDIQFALEQLASGKLQHKSDRTYQFWQEGVHPEQLRDRKMMVQKVEYIHQNPVKRGYVDKPEHWRYSSARDYAGMPGVLPVCREW